MSWLILLIIFLVILLLGANILFIKAFYWGPDGKPPQYKRSEARPSVKPDEIPKN